MLKEWTLYAMLGLLVVALWVPRLQGPIDLRWDGGVYYVLGTSILARLALVLGVWVSADDRAVWRAVHSGVTGRAIMRTSVPSGRPGG
jgi:hypothetical protein